MLYYRDPPYMRNMLGLLFIPDVKAFDRKVFCFGLRLIFNYRFFNIFGKHTRKIIQYWQW